MFSLVFPGEGHQAQAVQSSSGTGVLLAPGQLRGDVHMEVYAFPFPFLPGDEGHFEYRNRKNYFFLELISG